MRALVLQHVPFEASARIGDWIGRHCEHEHVCYLYADAHLPALDSFDLLVVMGGPMSVHDEAQYPWLVAEKRLIRAALDAGKKVLASASARSCWPRRWGLRYARDARRRSAGGRCTGTARRWARRWASACRNG